MVDVACSILHCVCDLVYMTFTWCLLCLLYTRRVSGVCSLSLLVVVFRDMARAPWSCLHFEILLSVAPEKCAPDTAGTSTPTTSDRLPRPTHAGVGECVLAAVRQDVHHAVRC
jgi:hypothetical protein